MRIALVLHDASPEPDGAPIFPAVALERDGALYRVSELARVFGARYASLAEADDFRHAVLSVGAEPLRELDERLLSGERPSSARLLPGTFTWLPPCDPQRASFFLSDVRPGAAREAPPVFRVGAARSLFGHESAVPLPPIAPSPAVDAGVAVVLADDLDHATASEADRAILGYALLLAWRPGLAAQLGPVLVTRDEAGDVPALRPLFRAAGVMSPAADLRASPFTPPEILAWISHHTPLQAGDVIAVATVATAPASATTTASAVATVAFGARVEVAMERLGRLAGRAVLGPDLRDWRRI